MVKSFHSGGAVNNTSGYILDGSVYGDPPYPMVSTRQALNGNRPIYISSWSPDYVSGSHTSDIGYQGSGVTGPTYFANSGGSYRFYVNNASGTVYFGRSIGDGYNTVHTGGFVWSGGLSHTVYYAEVPSAPRDIVATPAGGSAVNVSWSPPADDGGVPVTSYQIQASATSDFSTITAFQNVTAPSTSGTVTGLFGGSWFIRVVARNAVAANFSTFGPGSPPVSVVSGPVWTFAGNASYQARITNGGSLSDPGGPFQVYTTIPVSSIPIGQEVFAHIAFYVENPYNSAGIMAHPSIAWFSGDGRLISETSDPVELVPDATTHVFTSPVLGRPREAVTAEIRVTVPRFYSPGVPNVRTISPYDPVNSTRLYMDGVMISNRNVPFFDGSFPDSGWFGQPGLSASYQILGNTEPLFDMATEGGGKILSVDEGQIKGEVVRAGVFPVAIDNPVVSDIVPTPLGGYNVLDKDDNLVPASVWSSAGGYVQASPGDEWGQIVFTLFAPSDVPGHDGPFKIAHMSGTTQVAALRLSGAGVKDNPTTLRWPTGADESVSTEVGYSTDTPALATLDDVYTAGPWVVQSVGGPNPELTATLSLKDVQGFGVLPGSLVRYRDSQYRVTGVRMNGLQVTITAEWFVRVEESDALWVGKTVNERDAIWVGRKAKDRVIAPLRTT